MLKPGTKVQRLTKKVGQASPVGTVTALHGDSVEVRWDDGHTSIVERAALVPAQPANR